MLPEGHEQIKTSVILCLEANAFLFLMLGTLLNVWWQNGPYESPKYYGLWTRVYCDDDICRISTSETTGYIMFVQIISVSTIFLSFVALLAYIGYVFKDNKMLSYLSGGFSALAGFACNLMGIVLIAFYHRMSIAWNRDQFIGIGISPDVVRYQPVPLYFYFMAGFLSTVAFGFTIVTVNSKKLLVPPTYKRLGSRLTPQSLHEV